MADIKQRALRLNRRLDELLAAEAKKAGLSVNAFVERAIERDLGIGPDGGPSPAFVRLEARVSDDLLAERVEVLEGQAEDVERRLARIEELAERS